MLHHLMQVKGGTMQGRFSAVALVIATAGTALMLSGCQSGRSAATEPPGGGAAHTAEEQDQVSQEQYEAAFAAFSTCASDAGFPLVNPRLEGKLYDYAITEVGKQAADDCYLEFQAIDAAWQLQNEYDSPTQVALRECLSDAGMTPGPDVATVWRQLEEAKIDPADCVHAVGR